MPTNTPRFTGGAMSWSDPDIKYAHENPNQPKTNPAEWAAAQQEYGRRGIAGKNLPGEPNDPWPQPAAPTKAPAPVAAPTAPAPGSMSVPSVPAPTAPSTAGATDAIAGLQAQQPQPGISAQPIYGLNALRPNLGTRTAPPMTGLLQYKVY